MHAVGCTSQQISSCGTGTLPRRLGTATVLPMSRVTHETDLGVLPVRRLAGEALVAAEIDEKAAVIAELVERAANLDASAAEPATSTAGTATSTAAPAPETAGTATGAAEPAPETAGMATGDSDLELVDPADVGRPHRVRLVAPRELPRRTWGTPAGRFATLHALAHIEANAVNLALDAVHRFGAMPATYYADWTRVAAEELGHHQALAQRLATYGGAYGDLPCHDGLWDIAGETAHDVVERMALVPLVFEARGLDVTPAMIDRFDHHGDTASADVLRVILRDEVGHVAVGMRWFRHACTTNGITDRADQIAEFDRLVARHRVRPTPPFNLAARLDAGFAVEDLDRWSEPRRP